MEKSTYIATNRLADQISPYLLQHANNPVHWQPWDDIALEQALQQDKPIFLSIGYAACHWCHVMERESFENESIAALMNRYFVNIKVDREERPDLDDVYMKAVVAMTGQGGWPMSVFLTPELKPFYGGTYFPPEGRYGMPGFRDVVEQIAAYWAGDRSKLFENAERLTTLIGQYSAPVGIKSSVEVDAWINEAIEALKSSFDTENGGWGDAPKFPSSAAIRLLFRKYQRTSESSCLSMATKTLDKMRCGGIYDQLGGGFHRYAVDGAWRVPHFEKMLYDNALLVVAYLEAWQATGNEAYRTVVIETLDFLLRDMQDKAGGFYASLDADSEGGEGAYYLWTHKEIMEHLGEEAGSKFCRCYGVKPEGNFLSHEGSHHLKNVLLFQDSGAVDDSSRSVLLATRQQRPAPQRDDKVLTSWNALAITAFSRAAIALDNAVYADAALRAGRFLRDEMLHEGELRRSWRKGKSHLPAYLDDYAAFADACVDLYACSADFSWIQLAHNLVEKMVEDFSNEQSCGFYATSANHTHLLARMQPMQDTAEPSGNALAAHVLLRLGHILGEERYVGLAEKTFEATAAKMQHIPVAFLNMLLAGDLYQHGAEEITLSGCLEQEDMKAFRRIIGEYFIPNRLLIYAGAAERQEHLPPLQGRDVSDDVSRVWICRNRICSTPALNLEALRMQLDSFGRSKAGYKTLG